MIVGRCDFGPSPQGISDWDFKEKAETYLVSLLKNWQVLDDYDLVWVNDHLQAFATLSRRDSFEPIYCSDWGKACLESLSVSPKWEVFGNPSAEEQQYSHANQDLLLFTHFLDKQSPVLCIDSGDVLSLPTMPISDADRDYIFGWVGQYRCLDQLFMASEALELEAYREMACFDSSLSSQGLKICRNIERATGHRTFYYLHKYWGTIEEITYGRSCPGCGNDWLSTVPEELEKRAFLNFEFRCEECRLVSHNAKDVDDGVRAQAGCYKAP